MLQERDVGVVIGSGMRLPAGRLAPAVPLMGRASAGPGSRGRRDGLYAAPRPASAGSERRNEARMKHAELVAEADSGRSAPSTLRSHLVRTLRQQILGGRYRPGERLNESQIAPRI